MARDNNEDSPPAKTPGSLKDYLDSYRPEVSQDGVRPGPGSMAYWEVAREAARGRSARDWRAEWKAAHRPPIKKGRNWSSVWLTIGLIAALCLSVWGVVELDRQLDAMHWHWMNPNGAETVGDQMGPAINWGGTGHR